MKFLIWLIFAVGIAIRLPDIARPLNEGYRSAQTATLTAGMIEDGRLRFDPIAPWRGDLDARLVQELPVYNLVVLLVDTLPGVTIDIAGRLTSLIFWILSFIALQALWRRTLPRQAAFWANLLFIFAPMNWYLSTDFMPESLLQLLAIGFMVYVLYYAHQSTLGSFAGLFVTGLLGLLIKFPGFVHLGLFAALVLVDRHGWRSLLRPALLMAAAVVGIALLGWGEYVKSVNAKHFSSWAGLDNILEFIQPGRSRLILSYYVPLIGYNLAFIIPVIAAPFALLGFLRVCRRAPESFTDRVWLYLTGSLLLYWLIWGKAAPSQNYYNLQNLVLFSAMFGRGTIQALDWLRANSFPPWSLQVLRVFLAMALFGSGLAGFLYLARPDSVTIEVAEWAKANTKDQGILLYQPRHAAAVMDYPHQPLLSHLTGRRTHVIVRTTAPEELQAALQKGRVVIVTQPLASPGWSSEIRRLFKGVAPAPTESIIESHGRAFRVLHNGDTFTAAIVTN